MADCCDSCSNVVLPVGDTGPQGPQGNPGTDGTDGITLLFNYPAQSGSTYITNSTTASEALITDNIPASAFSAVGVALEIDFQLYITPGESDIEINFGGTTLFNETLTNAGAGTPKIFIKGKVTISRYNSNSLIYEVSYTYGTGAFGLLYSTATFAFAGPSTITPLTFSNTIPFSLECTADTTNILRVTKFIIKKLTY